MGAIERMTITLPGEMAGMVKGAVEQGDYASTSEVIREALRDWKMKREMRAQKLAELKAEIQLGLDDIEAGRVVEFDMDRIIAEGRKLREERQKQRATKKAS